MVFFSYVSKHVAMATRVRGLQSKMSQRFRGTLAYRVNGELITVAVDENRRFPLISSATEHSISLRRVTDLSSGSSAHLLS